MCALLGLRGGLTAGEPIERLPPMVGHRQDTNLSRRDAVMNGVAPTGGRLDALGTQTAATGRCCLRELADVFDRRLNSCDKLQAFAGRDRLVASNSLLKLCWILRMENTRQHYLP